ncbi:methylmalonyl Co-A mutase-associated GTPase MeaB [Lysinibacillus sp. RS5]|uniref:methylmalonyl Co-A mutase-associated GTPase MeaB n=2 Tax=Lysinibacillus TaxID=400634 RepID=UPI0035BE1F84
MKSSEKGALTIKHLDVDQMVENIKSRKGSALARAITIVENNDEDYLEIISKLYSSTGKSHIIGITGSPGTGKSTLVDKVAKMLSDNGKSVAVLAVDPSSPFSRGAILGDRIRMMSAQKTSDIFIRSMASRGEVGGLAKSVRNVITLFEAFGFDAILIETVGSGQTEVEIMNLAHTTLVVTAPGLGDEIQAQKAGIMEIADIFVVNKADLPTAKTTAYQIQKILSTEAAVNRKQVPIIMTSPVKETGITELVEKVEERWQKINDSGEREQIEKSHAYYKLMESIKDKFWGFMKEEVMNSANWSTVVDEVYKKDIYPEQAADDLFSEFFVSVKK